MRRIIISFLFFMLVYHILHTFLVYGVEVIPLGVFSSLKEVFLIAMLVGLCWFLRNHIVDICKLRKKECIVVFLIFGIFLLVSYVHGVALDSLLVGIKYDLWWLLILIVGVLAGYALQGEYSASGILRSIMIGLSLSIICGILWQLGKRYFPDFFTWFGYGPVGDYSLGSHPPLYYRTGPGGWMRFSGIFSGPNNFAYFLVAFFPVIAMQWLKGETHALLSKGSDIALLCLIIVSVMFTFSRAAMGALFIQSVILLYMYRPLWRKYLLVGCMIGCIGLSSLLVFKLASTLEHLEKSKESLQVVREYPWGLGLGTAGPSIHYHGVYLPENQYLQRAIDGGALGLFCILVFIVFLFRRIYHYDYNSPEHYFALSFSIGFFGLLLIGIFLHSFEDSMVNYLFFLSYGVVLSAVVKLKG